MISRRVAWAVAICATLTMTVSYVDRSTFAVLSPTITKQLGISETAYGWLSAAFSMAYLVGTPLAGWWIDRIGARRGLVISLLAWTMVAALHALAPSFAALFALRIALGLAEGPSFPGAAQTIQRIVPAHERSRGFGVLFTGSSIGWMLAPPLAGALFAVGEHHYGDAGWRFALLTSSLVGLAWLPLWIAMTSRRDVKPPLDARELPRARAALGELVSHPAMLRAWAAIVAVAPIGGFGLLWGAKYLDRIFGVKQAAVGHYLWLPPLIFDAAAILFGDLAARQRRASGTRPRLLFGIGVLLAASIALLPLVATPWQGIVVIGIAMGGSGIVYVLTTSDLLSRVAPHQVASASGTVAAAQSLALIIAPPLVGASVDHFQSYDVAALALAAWAIPGCLVWLAWRPPVSKAAR